jgi:hypothetical protein
VRVDVLLVLSARRRRRDWWKRKAAALGIVRGRRLGQEDGTRLRAGEIMVVRVRIASVL